VFDGFKVFKELSAIESDFGSADFSLNDFSGCDNADEFILVCRLIVVYILEHG